MTEHDDNIIREIGEILEKEDIGSRINYQQVANVQKMYNDLKKTVSGRKLSSNTEFHEPFISSGYITFTGNRVEFNDTKLLYAVAKNAINLDFVPLSNGKIEVDFSFPGIVN